MSSSGSPWFNPFADDSNWDPARARAVMHGGINGSLGAPGGLFGAQWDHMQANSPSAGGIDWAALGANPGLSINGTGLPPSVTIAPSSPRLPDPISGWPPQSGGNNGTFTVKVGLPAPSDAVDYMLNCMTQYYPGQIRVTSTSEPSKSHP